MSEVKRRELFPGVWLRAVHTNQFKSAYLSVTLMAPLDGATAAENSLIPAVLRRGTRTHPDMESMSAALDELYGGAIEPVVRKKGETQCIGFVASFLDDAYTLEGDPILEPAAALLGELLLSPRTEGEGFLPDYVHQEQNNLIDRIRAQVNDKRRYASARLCQLMCREEAFGVDKLGDETSAASVTPDSLWQRYQALLNTAAVEVYYSGSAQSERVEAALRSALSALPANPNRVVPDCEVRLTADWNTAALLATGGSLNYGGWSDLQCDQLLEACRTSTDHEAALNALCRYLQTQSPILPLCFETVSALYESDVVEGLTPTAAEPFYDLSSCIIHLKAS